MDKHFINNRICELLGSKQRSLRQASLDLGYSDSYLNAIVNGRVELKTGVLLKICDYLDVAPAEFFSAEPLEEIPLAEREVATIIHKMSPRDRDYICDSIRRFAAYRNQLR